MKLTTILLLATGLTASAAVHSQQVSYKAKNASLQSVLQAIKEQTGYVFIYNDKDIAKASPVSMDLKNAAIDVALQQAFKDQPLTYEVKGTSIVIKEKKSLELTGGIEPGLGVVAPASHDVSGRITDENGKPLHGASVKVKGTQLGTSTNADGVFVLKNVDEKATLAFSFVGYESVVLAVGNRTSFAVSLKASENNLQEVVINKGYYSEKQRFSVGNTVRVDAKEIEKHPVGNVMTAIQGLVSGLEVVQYSGLNGGGVKFRIQGRNSISNGLDPLVVVDGVPYPSQMVATTVAGPQAIQDPTFGTLGYLKGGSPLNYLNLSDIESVEILKDADATSLYGSRAANGAILITTKKGKAGAAKITVNIQQGWSRNARHADMMNTRQYLTMRNEAFKNDNRIPSANPLATLPFVYAPDLMIWDTTKYTDWQKVLTGNSAQYTNANASISGGNANLQYLIGGTYNRKTTVFPGDYADQNSTAHFSISGSSDNQRFKATLTGSYMMGNNNLPGQDYTQIAIQLEPNAPALFNPDGSLNWAPNAAGTSTWVNPLASIYGNDFLLSAKSLVSNLSLNYKIVSGLSANVNLGYTSLDNTNTLLSRLEQYKPEQRASRQRTTSLINSNTNSWIVEPQLQYNHNIGHGKLDALVGTTIQKSSYDYLNLFASGFSSDAIMKTLLAAQTVKVANNKSGVNRYNSLFARISYNYSDKYLMTFNYRRDGSNKFGDNNKFGDFWSAGVGWIFSEEKWLKSTSSWLSFGKLRMSYGVTGNDQIADFSYLSVYNLTNPSIQYQGIVGWQASNIGNPYLQWERTRKLQGGIDLGFLKDRINLSAGYALNRSDNQLTNYPLSTPTGFNSIVINQPALVQNTSFELSLSTVNIKTKDFSWSTSFNITVPKNKLVSFPGIENTSYALNGGSNGVIIGQPLGIITRAKYLGINPASGRVLIADSYGNPISLEAVSYDPSSSKFKQIFISTDSKYYGGINTSFKYKHLQLSALFYYNRSMGPQLLEWSNGSAIGPGIVVPPTSSVLGSSNQPASAFNRWQAIGDVNVHNSKYSTLSNYATDIQTTDAYYSYNASYVRLKNLSLSWQVPKSLLGKTKIDNLFISVLAENLITFTKYSGLDPESGSGLPPLQTVTFQARIGF